VALDSGDELTSVPASLFSPSWGTWTDEGLGERGTVLDGAGCAVLGLAWVASHCVLACIHWGSSLRRIELVEAGMALLGASMSSPSWSTWTGGGLGERVAVLDGARYAMLGASFVRRLVC
jgi:hypothetical protein